MGAEHVVGVVGGVAVVGAVVAIVLILRSGSIVPPEVFYPRCASCGHEQPEHDRSKGRCHHDYGHHTWNNDSYGNSQQRYGDTCDCTGFRHRERPDRP
ncbi:hypothetical protein [Streptomyces sp. NPDC057689]|uniref:hypothetical protein n=1 Tax=Streptomyces sp. NPDC057689 TaxID=3346213 RepID=UPI0036BEF11F